MFHWNKLNRTELQCYEYHYQLHLAKQSAQRKGPTSLLTPAQAHYQTSLKLRQMSQKQSSLPRTAFESPEWYGPPGGTGGSSDSDAEAPSPISLTMHPELSLAAAMLSSEIQDSDAASASTQ